LKCIVANVARQRITVNGSIT